MGYNNKILVSYGTFNLQKNDKVNTYELVKEINKPKSDKAVEQPSLIKPQHEDEKVALALLLIGGFRERQKFFFVIS